MSRAGTGQFVYSGKGGRRGQGDNATSAEKNCTKQACAIQWCLARRNHSEKACKAFIDDYDNCVAKYNDVDEEK